MKYLHALLARDRENLQENPRALLLLTCKLAEHMLQTIILNTLPQSPRTGTGKSTKIIEKRFVTNMLLYQVMYTVETLVFELLKVPISIVCGGGGVYLVEFAPETSSLPSSLKRN